MELGIPLVAAVPTLTVAAPVVEASQAADVVELSAGPRTVVLIGDATPGQGAEARACAEVAGLPLLAEPSSNARSGPNAVRAYRLLLESSLAAGIERVICFGHPTISRSVTALLSREDIDLVVVSGGADWHDVGSRASRVCDRVIVGESDSAWLAAWLSADADLSARLPEPELDGHAVAAAVLAAVGPEENLVWGSSQTIRDADLAPVATRPAQVFANRGLAGIDGTVATATGIALATSRPTTVVLGDLTLQHDLGALVAPSLEPAAHLRVVVIDDDGGAIFATLEQGAPEHQAAFERVFGTPQGVDLAGVATALGWTCSTVDARADLAPALAETWQGRRLIRVQADRAHRRETEARLRGLGGAI